MSSKRFRIGYALSPKKEKTFITSSLLAYTNHHGIDLVRIDPHTPLLRQTPFVCIIHKLDGAAWIQNLCDFQSKYPNIPIIDPPELVSRLHNRISMLEVVNEIKIVHQGNEKVEIPKQIVVYDREMMGKLAFDGFGNSGLKFPVIAKQVIADGSPISHEMYLVFDVNGLKELNVPIVIQEFVNHGGVIFKVYVVGEHVKCVKRKSLQDISEEKLEKLDGFLTFSQISNLVEKDTKRVGENCDGDGNDDEELPCLSFVVELARGLREVLGLRLFNFDLIKDVRDLNRYLVIDINYFPGYAKMPSYEPVFTGFLFNVVKKSGIESSAGLDNREGEEVIKL